MSRIPDPVAVVHPDFPGQEFVIARRSFPSRQRRGWIEAKSPPADAAVESPSLEDTTPSQEAQP